MTAAPHHDEVSVLGGGDERRELRRIVGEMVSLELELGPRLPPVLADRGALEQVVLAPHMGSATTAARDGMALLVADNVIAVLGGGAPVTPV